jgi:hypothetical protein
VRGDNRRNGLERQLTVVLPHACALPGGPQTSIVSIIRQGIPCPPDIKQLTLPIDDGPSTDILSHLPASVDWVHAAIQAGDGGVLVHCQAGMSE